MTRPPRKSSRKPPKRTPSSPTWKGAACNDRFGHAGVSSTAGAGAGFDPSIFADFGDIFGGLGDIFGFGDILGGGRRRAALSAVQTCGTTSRSRSKNRHAAPRRRFRFHARKPAKAAMGPELRPVQLRPCARSVTARGRCATSRDLHRRSNVSSMPRERPSRHETLPHLPRHRPRQSEAKITVKIPAGIRDRAAAAASGRR